MKPLLVNVSRALFLLAIAFAGTPVLAGHVLDFRVLGRGAVVNDCSLLPSALNCNIVLAGQASGTHIGHDDFSLTLQVNSTSQRLTNGQPNGFCAVVTGFGTLTPPSTATTISFNVAGTVCNEGAGGSPAHFDGTYRITGGSARFSDAAGGGSLTATWTRWTGGVVFLYLNGTIDY